MMNKIVYKFQNLKMMIRQRPCIKFLYNCKTGVSGELFVKHVIFYYLVALIYLTAAVAIRAHGRHVGFAVYN